MKFNIALTIDKKAEHKEQQINSLSVCLEEFFKNKHYGNEVKEISILCICVDVPMGYEHLFKVNKPKYVDNKIIINKYTGEKLELNQVLLFDIKFSEEDYSKYINLSAEESEKVFINLLLASIQNLTIPKKINDFNKNDFFEDIQNFLLMGRN